MSDAPAKKAKRAPKELFVGPVRPKSLNRGLFQPGNQYGKKNLRADITEEEVAKLAGIGATLEEMADWFKCDQTTLLSRFDQVIKENRANAKMSLRRKQLQAANEGNTTMLIWLGKVWLKQKEAPQVAIQINNAEKTAREIPVESLDEWEGK